MKALSKPISSPGRADKFPPPLLKFLRSNVGSKSRGRSRSSPMFYLRSKKSSAAIIVTTQEPSSPKVTCIGQVRVRRTKKSTAKRTGSASSAANHRRCSWVPKPLFCCKTSSRFRVKKRPFRRIFGKWGLFIRFGYCKKVDATEDSFRVYSNNQKSEKNGDLVRSNNSNTSSVASESEAYGEKYDDKFGASAQENKRDSVDSSSSTPPKNAFLLTRCRSAPYRSSSLGARYWGSPMKDLENKSAENEAKSEESQNPSCENVVEVEESRISQESVKEIVKSENKIEDLNGIPVGTVHPLLLTRCKSEPARTGVRLVPEANFWKQRRSGVVEPCLHHNS